MCVLRGWDASHSVESSQRLPSSLWCSLQPIDFAPPWHLHIWLCNYLFGGGRLGPLAAGRYLQHSSSRTIYIIVVVCSLDDKSYLLSIGWVHKYLVVAIICIQKAQNLVDKRTTHQAIDAREKVCVLRTGFVEINEVCAHLLLSIHLCYLDHHFQSHGVCDLSNETHFLELLHNNLHNLYFLLFQPPLLLRYQRCFLEQG